jgi:hypothetical protein
LRLLQVAGVGFIRGTWNAALVCAGLCAGVAIGEVIVRELKPPPRVQIVAAGGGLRDLDGTPVWGTLNDREHRECVDEHPERVRIFVTGSSISYGVSVDEQAVFTTLLERRLNELRPNPGFCVLNFAQPGFGFEQKYAVARVEVPRYRPALFLWEGWPEWGPYRRMGNVAVNVRGYRLRPDGYVGILGVPDSLNHLLFDHSAFYRYAALATGGLGSDPEANTLVPEQALEKVLSLATSVGAKLALYPSTPLDRPFAESVDFFDRAYLEFARQRGVALYPLARELVNEDYRRLRLDPCCHFNAEGHRVLTRIFEPIVLELLDGAPPKD